MYSVNNNVSTNRRLVKMSLMYRWLFNRLNSLPISAIEVVRPDGIVEKVGQLAANTPVPRLKINRQGAVLKIINGGMLGWADAYIAGDWDTPDLFALTDWAMANERALENAFKGTFLTKVLNRLIHLLRPNNRSGSKKNIAAHYDLGNDFYHYWLDSSMTYSSAVYKHEDESLEHAQQHKYQRIIELLNVSDEQDVLEVGCGWGGFAETLLGQLALNSYKGITLSREQLVYARDKLSMIGFDGICLQDYRDVSGEFDRIVSIEMIEAVGEAYWTTYFQTIANRLRQDGVAVIQAITIDDDRFNDYRKGSDFIQKYIFPGGMLPSDKVIHCQAGAAGLKLKHKESFAHDYVRTLQTWSDNFNDHWADIAALGFDERFRRMWNYYFAYCQAGFKSGSINVSLYVLTKDDLS